MSRAAVRALRRGIERGRRGAGCLTPPIGDALSGALALARAEADAMALVA